MSLQPSSTPDWNGSVSPAVSPATFRRVRPLPLVVGTSSTLGKEYTTSTQQSLKHPTKELQETLMSQDSLIKFTLNDLQIVGSLGAGSGGSVSKVIHKPSGMMMARKLIPGAYGDDVETLKSEKRLMREVRLMKSCKSPYIVAFFGALFTDGDVILLMEYMDLGSLESVYKKLGSIEECVVRPIAVAVLRGLDYLHREKNVVHRDIKPSNILLNSKGEIKIGDFGVSKDNNSSTKEATFTGTQGYLAPERITNVGSPTIASDLWSFGLTIIEIATGKFPYHPTTSPGQEQAGIMDLYEMIIDEPSPTLPPSYPQSLSSLLQTCLQKDPLLRKTPAELLQMDVCVQSDPAILLRWAMELMTYG